jgi:hypothetical protein
MKTLYVTISEFVAIAVLIEKWQGNWGGFKSPEVATHNALEEVLGPEIAERCIWGVRLEIVTSGSMTKTRITG